MPIEATGGSTGGTRVWADAVRLSTNNWFGSGEEPTSSGYHVLEGTWSISSVSVDRYGPSYQYTTRDGVKRRAAWYFNVLTAEEYSVYACWLAGSNSVPDVKFTIRGATGETVVSGNQKDEANNGPAGPATPQVYSKAWRFLCNATFSPATLGKVEIENTGSGGTYVVADAVAITRKITTQFSRSVIGYLYLGYRSSPGGTTAPDEAIILPSSVIDLDNPAGTPILIDLYSPGNQEWTTHSDGVHALYLDGHVDWIPAAKTKLRWTDTYGNGFYW